jgi:uncharacterized OsmC-like protein
VPLLTPEQNLSAITLEGPLTDEERHRLIEIAARCPVSQTLDKGADLRTTLAEVGPIETETG